MSKNQSTRPSRARIRLRTQELRRAIAAMDFVVSGTICTRTKVCGRPNCSCARDTDARHGPYHEWLRHQEGRLVRSTVTAEQAARIGQAIANYREVQALLARWQKEAADEILQAHEDEGG